MSLLWACPHCTWGRASGQSTGPARRPPTNVQNGGFLGGLRG